MPASYASKLIGASNIFNIKFKLKTIRGLFNKRYSK